MKRFDLKQLLLCIATLVSSQFELAGVYPLIPAVFMTGFLSGVNRSLLFLCTMGGLIILAPVTVLVKYGLIVLLSAVLIRGVNGTVDIAGPFRQQFSQQGSPWQLASDGAV